MQLANLQTPHSGSERFVRRAADTCERRSAAVNTRLDLAGRRPLLVGRVHRGVNCSRKERGDKIAVVSAVSANRQGLNSDSTLVFPAGDLLDLLADLLAPSLYWETVRSTVCDGSLNRHDMHGKPKVGLVGILARRARQPVTHSARLAQHPQSWNRE